MVDSGRYWRTVFYVPSNSYTANNPLYAALALAHEAKHMDKELAQTEPRWREADAVNAQLAVAYGLLGLSSLTDEQKDQLRFYVSYSPLETGSFRLR